MKKLFSIVFAFTLAPPALALDVDWKLYMRAGVGTNSEGGKEFILQNPGSRGNEFRLGNEITYAEASFTGHVLKPQDSKEFFDANLTFAYMPSMNSQYNDTSANGDNTHVIQAFVKGGNFDGVNVAFWAGKRFYRDVELHMDDFFYFADMSGVGGGVEDIDVGNGTLAFALLQHADNVLINATNGSPAKQAIDIRWRDLKFSENDSLQIWLAGAYTSPGTGTKMVGAVANTVDYEAGYGMASGVRWRHQFAKLRNDLAVMYATGVMDTFNMESSAVFATTNAGINTHSRTRVIENPVIDISNKWSISAGLVLESGNSTVWNNSTVAPKPGNSHWYSAGIRPIYNFTDHFHLSFEAGHSIVSEEGETTTGGASVGARTLTRVTLAPEVALGNGFFSRPVIRAFVTRTWWNRANQDPANPNSMIGNLNSQKITALNGKLDETQVGVQAEVWF